MKVKRYLAPTGRVLREAPDTKGFVLFSFLIFCFLRVVFVWGYHNLFHMAYLLLTFSFFQNEFLSMFIMRNIKDPLSPEELSAAKKISYSVRLHMVYHDIRSSRSDMDRGSLADSRRC